MANIGLVRRAAWFAATFSSQGRLETKACLISASVILSVYNNIKVYSIKVYNIKVYNIH